MPTYSYRALRQDGNEATGLMDADTDHEARLRIRQQGLYVTAIEEVAAVATPRTKRFSWSLGLSFGRTGEQVALVTRQMATLVSAEVPLVDVLSILIEQVEHPAMSLVLRDVREKITSGRSLADALSAHRRYFSDMYVNMVRAGEASGKLDSVLDSLAAYAERRTALKSRVSAALIYPAILMVAGAAVVAFLVSYVVPKFGSLLDKAGQGLPLPTAILMAVSDFVRHRWWLLVAVIVAAAVGWRLLRRWERFRVLTDGLLLRVPILGDLFRKQFIAYFATTLATLLASGIRVADALIIAQRIMENRVLAAAVASLQEEILSGHGIASTLKKGRLFPPLVSHMVAVGEKSGRLEEMLRKIAASYEQEVAIALQKLIAVMEPAIVVVMAAVVAFIVAAILLPILSLSQMVS